MNQDRYDDTARERIVEEPPKRVDAPVRTAFERDRARVVHAAASRRLAAKTQRDRARHAANPKLRKK